jgi:hypothetical protein
MPTKPLELPPKVAQAFVRDMRAFFKAKNQLEQDEIASRQLHALQAFQRPRDKRLAGHASCPKPSGRLDEERNHFPHLSLVVVGLMIACRHNSKSGPVRKGRAFHLV